MAPIDKGGVPFRSDVHLVIENLSAEGNELGLWTLALTANRFRANSLPENAQSIRQFVRRDRKDEVGPTYVHLKVDVCQPDKIARDENGVPVPMFEWDVVWASDQLRASVAYTEHRLRLLPPPAPSPDAATGTEENKPSDANGEATGSETTGSETKPDDTSFNDSGSVIPNSRRAADYRRGLRSGLENARIALDGLTEIDHTSGSWPPVIESADFDALRQSLLELQTDLENLRRNIQGEDPVAPAETEDDDST